MSLVPYAGSDISDSEEELDDTSVKVNGQSSVQVPTVEYGTKASEGWNNATAQSKNVENESEQPNVNALNLPQPKLINDGVIEEDDEFLRKKPVKGKEKKPVQIHLPTLKRKIDDADESEIVLKKFTTPSSKGTGLFSMLPPPKYENISNMFKKANSLTDTPNIPVEDESRTVKASIRNLIPQRFLKKKNDDVNDDLDDEPVTNDFFSLDGKHDDVSVTYEEEDVPVEPSIASTPVVISTNISEYSELYATTSNQNKQDIDSETLLRLSGRRKNANIEIVDVTEKDVLPDGSVWRQEVLKQKSDPFRNAPPINETGGPGGMHKRKHQITYLAHQAKVNEQQLQGMWAQNRANQQMSRSKYGF